PAPPPFPTRRSSDLEIACPVSGSRTGPSPSERRSRLPIAALSALRRQPAEKALQMYQTALISAVPYHLEQGTAGAGTVFPSLAQELANYTQNAGGAVFRTWCAQCHGSGAAGAMGYPNLLDNDWLWGGTMEDIHTTITHGIRNTTDADARYSEMPKFGADGLLEPEQIDQVVQYVLQISGQEHDAALAGEGAVVFTDNCAACHMEDGTGDRAQGAPNLTDAIWLFGGDQAAPDR